MVSGPRPEKASETHASGRKNQKNQRTAKEARVIGDLPKHFRLIFGVRRSALSSSLTAVASESNAGGSLLDSGFSPADGGFSHVIRP